MNTLGPTDDSHGNAAGLLRGYLRLVAILFLCVGLLRAAIVIGMFPDSDGFLGLDAPWRAGLVALVILDLFAAAGLWMAASWGPVIWAVAALVEIAMYTVFADLFGVAWLRVFAHIGLVAVYVAIMVYVWFRHRDT